MTFAAAFRHNEMMGRGHSKGGAMNLAMYAKAIQGMPAEAAVKWAHDELVKAYA
jgi:hypothetical protein